MRILPEIEDENCFALHGGTAIKLFLRKLPRLSVEIDRTYLPLEDFETSQGHINEALKRIVKNTQKVLPSARIQHDERSCKLIVNEKSEAVKVEVSIMGRGCIYEPKLMPLYVKAQEDFDAFVELKVLNYVFLWILKVEIKQLFINYC